MSDKLLINYTLEKVEEGFVSRCSTNPKVTSFGATEEEAGDNLIVAIREYLDLYPDKQKEIFNTPTKEFTVSGNDQ